MYKKKGFSLLELMMVMGIVGIFVVATMQLSGLANRNLDTLDAVNSMKTLVSNIKELYQSSPGYTGISNNSLLSAGIVPESVIKSQDIIGLVVSPATINGIPDIGFQLTYKVTEKVCVNHVKSLYDYALNVNLNGADVKLATGTLLIYGLPASTLAGICTTGATASNTITVLFGK